MTSIANTHREHIDQEVIDFVLANPHHRFYHPAAIACAAETGPFPDAAGIKGSTIAGVYRALSWYAHPETGYGAPFQQQLAEDTGYCPKSIQRALDKLVLMGLTQKLRQDEAWDKRRCYYRLTQGSGGEWTPQTLNIHPEGLESHLYEMVQELEAEKQDLQTEKQGLEAEVEYLLSLVPSETRLEFVATRVQEEEIQDFNKVPSSSSWRTGPEVPDLGSSISGPLSGEDEATHLSDQLADDYAWVDKNWQKTGWRNPEAAKWKARKDPDGFAKERLAYEAEWRASARKSSEGSGQVNRGHTRPTVDRDPKGRLPCHECGELKAKQVIFGNLCPSCRQAGS